ncbi:MAG: hypothetical protein DRJ05_18290, partial [Bacteroidetes bacterium]
KVYPCWTDNRGGVYMTYVSAYALSLNAEFTADAEEICNGSSVTFNDVSTGEPISWDWSFPGGSPDSFIGQNPPAITYSAVGSYSVTLIVSDGEENDTETKTDFIEVKDVIAEFSGTPTTVVIGNTVIFTDESSCDPTSWTWSFPGGVPDTFDGQTPPAIQYDVEGVYDVTLTVTNASGSDTKTKTGYITVLPPEFNMTNGTITTCMGNFYDSGGPSGSYGNGENFTMTFYPGNTGDMIRFNFTAFEVENNYDYLYIYDGEDATAPLVGTYSGDVQPSLITANNTSGALTFVFTSDGSVTYAGWVAEISCYSGTEPPVTDFVASNVYPGIGADVIFSDLTMNLPTSWEWSFVPATVVYINGTDEFSQNPEVQFTEVGLYTVSLTATNDFGNDTETKTDYITVDIIYNMADGTVTTCEGTFFDSGGPIDDYQDNENYTMTFYPATTGDMTRFNFTEFEVNSLDYLNIYNGEDATAMLIGVYSDGIVPNIVTANNITGALTFVFTSNGSSTNSGWAAEISCYTITEPPVADFVASDTVPVINTNVFFTDLSSNLPTSWEWSFDPTTVTYMNGTDEFSQNPEVQFTELGFYNVSLTATNGFGSGSETKDDYIEVVEPSLCLDGLYTTGCSLGDGLTSWDLVNVNVPVIECGNGDPYDWYHDFTDMIHALEAGGDYILTVQCGYSNTYLDVWIDYNEDLILDDDEHIVDDYLLAATGTDYEIPITIPTDAPDGQFILRYRTNWNSALTVACDTYTYGNMCDFTAEIGEPEFPAPTNLTVEINVDDITLSWTAPENATPDSYNVYRDDILLSNTTETTYTDIDVANGTYEYCVTAVYTDGESYNVCTTVITELPEADFIASNTAPGLNADVVFTDLTTNAPSSWLWSFTPSTVVFINGTSETSQNPEVQFTEVGLYTVSLIASNYFGDDTETKADYIYVDIVYNMSDGTVTSCTGT